jgi:hypothetical protein
MAERVGLRPGDPQPSGIGQAPQAAGGCVAVHPGAAAEQDGAVGAGPGRSVDGPPDGWWQLGKVAYGVVLIECFRPLGEAAAFAER